MTVRKMKLKGSMNKIINHIHGPENSVEWDTARVFHACCASLLGTIPFYFLLKHFLAFVITYNIPHTKI
jgi:hypothetical protein